ncbi:cyclic nucleotide-binding domain-containing protein [Candidatus Entotheonella palauensis]|uniref:cyclic nucleotide-binding domain-containing protein n=1 Tax=Candidatus Entotheonella palauensis TaxID=93172 RepID=UPI000B7FD02A|nr:cyclic nucleotide-binding domain-containing protein [Candidatus Entotheonella palauensis]
MESVAALISQIHKYLPPLNPGSNSDVSPLPIVHLVAGEVLFQQGDPSNAVYIIASGELVVKTKGVDGTETEVNRHHPGAIIGEMAAMTNQPRSATVYAATDATLECMDKDTFKQIASENHEFLSALTQLVTQRWRQSALTEVLAERFHTIEPTFWRELEPQLKWRHLSAGDVLCRQGDPSDCLYIIVSGRLRLRVTDNDGREGDIGEVAPGETVGEFGLITDAPRSATVYAIRETNVVELSPDGFETLLQRYPSVLRDIVKIIAERQQRVIGFGQRSNIAAFALALVPVSPHLRLEDFAEALVQAWPTAVNALVLSSQRFDALYGYPGAAQATFNDPIHPSIVAWMGKQENQHQLLIYIADFEWSAWTQRCLNQADQVLVIAAPNVMPKRSQTEEAIAQLPVRLRTDLVLWHQAEATRPHGTAAWLDRSAADAHHHIRHGDPVHMKRLARRLSGNAVGLVLSGGGRVALRM